MRHGVNGEARGFRDELAIKRLSLAESRLGKLANCLLMLVNPGSAHSRRGDDYGATSCR